MPILCNFVALCGLMVAQDSPSPNKIAQSAIQQILESLPGKKSVLFTELTDKGPVPLVAIHADDRYPIGSAIKLYILAMLIEEVNEGRRRLDNTMLLHRHLFFPKQSELASWPADSPVTIHTLALKMISASDNTAADHLMFMLGRKQIEDQMQKIGHGTPGWNRPLLSTRELVLLRDKNFPARAKEYGRLGETDRRIYLQTQLPQVPDFDKVQFDAANYDDVEWFATPLDMARALQWIEQETAEYLPSRLLRDILAINPNLTPDHATWPFVGYKGGSENQLVASNWLLRHKNGRWYTFHLFWNSKEKKVDPKEILDKAKTVFSIIEKQVN